MESQVTNFMTACFLTVKEITTVHKDAKQNKTGEQATHWGIQNKENANLSWWSRFVLDVPVDSLLSSMADFVPYDR